MSTSAGWDGVLDGIINEDDCEEPDNDRGYPGNCGSSTIGITYLLSYLVISFLIVINMYIAVILENYSQATEDVQEGLTDDDYDMYYEIWQQFDPEGTQYIRYDQLSDFLDVLEPPLQIHKPNKYKIISMDIPICRNDMMFCVDILDALTKDFFARKGNPIEETGELGEVAARPDEVGYEPVSSTLWRQREEYCARLIQNAWRKHKLHKDDDPDGDEDDDDDDDEDDDDNHGPAGDSNRKFSNNNNNGNNNISKNGGSGEGGHSNHSLKNGGGNNGGGTHKTSHMNNSNSSTNNNLNSSNSHNIILSHSTSNGGGTTVLGKSTTACDLAPITKLLIENTCMIASASVDPMLVDLHTGRQTAVLVESDGFVTKNGHKVVIHSRSPSITSRTADV